MKTEMPKGPKPRERVKCADVDISAANDTLERRIQKHKLLVEQGAERYKLAMECGDAECGKLQMAYNQSLKTLVMLEQEQGDRKKAAGELITADEARAAMAKLAGLVVNRLESLANECAENCNPGAPTVAIEVLAAWALDARKRISEYEL